MWVKEQKCESPLPLFCHELRWERITQGRSFVKNDGSDLLMVAFLKERREWILSLFKKEWLSKVRWEKFTLGHVKTNEKMLFFSQSLVYLERFAWITSESLKSNKSNSLTVTLFQRVTRANRSQLLFNMNDFEQKSEFPNLLKILLLRWKLHFTYIILLNKFYS